MIHLVRKWAERKSANALRLARRSLRNHLQGEQEYREHRVLRLSAGTRQHDRGAHWRPSGYRCDS